MGIFSRKQTFTEPVVTSDLGQAKMTRQEFGVPLVKIGGGDITKPYIDSAYNSKGSYVRFGHDNCYPSLMDQMYYQSPLHSTLVDFQINAAIGGGWEIESPSKSGKDEVSELLFIKKMKLDKTVRAIALDIKMHGRSHFMIRKDTTGKAISATRIIPSKVRYNYDLSQYWISDNWLTSSASRVLPAYSLTSKDEYSVYTFSDVDSSPGQDVYPLPKEISVFNWCYLDGQSSTLQKANIEKSIFGNVVIRRPKSFDTPEQAREFQESVSMKEGQIVPVLVLSGNGIDNVPTVESFPANQNDKVFEGMFNRIDEKICQAHSINPVLILSGTGGLGSGSDIEAVYPIWEKNTVLPFRTKIEEVVNDLLLIFDVKGEFRLEDFQIIDGRIVDNEIKEAKEAELQDDKPVVNDNLKGLSASENSDIYRIIRDHAKGRLNTAIATHRLMSYGLDKKTAGEILNENN